MKIEPTEEMQQVLGFRDDAAAQIDAILAIVERDYIVQKRCTEQLSPDIRCDLPEGKDGHTLMNAQHWCKLASTGTVVTWR